MELVGKDSWGKMVPVQSPCPGSSTLSHSGGKNRCECFPGIQAAPCHPQPPLLSEGQRTGAQVEPAQDETERHLGSDSVTRLPSFDY